ncbi:hypothetical protein [Flaviaesturariibacter flavus]|uniref:hypothetical protein n=1 Tax=Flaviaesturariibacter flavus TaxID=2502780 RepID=UPI00140524F5|nr:hypothetical protein [Flaviaesturariibacter flavus]
MSTTRITRLLLLRLFRSHIAFTGRRAAFRWVVLLLLLFHCGCILVALLGAC